jgi:hypothetical protein
VAVGVTSREVKKIIDFSQLQGCGEIILKNLNIKERRRVGEGRRG